MPKNSCVRVPSYRKHKPSGRAVVTISGKDIYLGKHGTVASGTEYNRLISEFMVSGGNLPQQGKSDYTIAELMAAFMSHAESYYRSPDGKKTAEVRNYKMTIRHLKSYYPTSAADFGPLALEAVRHQMIGANLSRITINQRANRIRHVFKRAVSKQLVAPSVLQGLQALEALRAGRSKTKETANIKPVPDAFVDAALPYVSRQVAAMNQLQRIAGMRSGEVTTMRACDIDTSGKVWLYKLSHHKTAWHGHERCVYLGPKAQDIIKQFLSEDLRAFLFSPAGGLRDFTVANWNQ